VVPAETMDRDFTVVLNNCTVHSWIENSDITERAIKIYYSSLRSEEALL
jgi:hypothetical protein